MAINNEPTIQPRTVTGIFTNYIAKVLPLAFDDSMSYYECLCALLNYINDTIVPDINNTNDGLGELQGFYEDLQSYINNYFENLDVQTEINNKLDQMAQDGTLTNLIKDYIDPIYQEFEADINEQVSNISSDINTLSARMDTFSTLTDGSTSGDAELEDIRIGYNGVTSSNAGTSVRNQANDLNDKIYQEINNYTRFNVDFVRGSVNTSGIQSSVLYRIRSYNRLIFNHDILVPYEIGIYRNTIITFPDSEATTGGTTLANRRGYLEIPANTYFYIVVRKQTEDTSETADIYTMQKCAVYCSDLEKVINNTNNDIATNKANISKCIQSNYYTLTEIEGTLTTGKYINARTGEEFTSANGQYLYINSGFNAGDNVVFNGFTGTDVALYPAIFFVDSKNRIIKKMFGDSNSDRGAHRNIETVIPYGTTKIYINGSQASGATLTPIMYKKTYDTSFNNIVYPLNIAEALVREAKKNPFKLAPLDKGYITFVFDDSRSDVDKVAAIFAEYGYKLGLATIPSRLSDTCDGLSETTQGYTVGMSVKDVCQRVVTLGGEILSHNSQVITEENQYNKEFMYNYFINSKKVLEDNGFTIRGLIRAGGSGAISQTAEIEKWLIGNYEYSNQGTADNYNQDRVNITTSKDSLKTQILSAYNNHTWIKIMGHGLADTTSGNYISESDLREILSYCNTIGITVCNYSDIFDNFSSSQFLNSLN